MTYDEIEQQAELIKSGTFKDCRHGCCKLVLA
jgi:hypothetical protein